MSFKLFLSKAKELYNNKYDYSRVIFKNYKTHITILCPNHGKFITTPELHIRRNIECKKCKYEAKLLNFKKVTTIKCSKCNIKKPTSNYFKSKKSLTGFEKRCKSCYYKYMNRYYKLKPNILKKCQQQYQQKTNYKHSKQWYRKNKKYFSLYRKIWYYANRNYILLQQTQYRKSNRGKLLRRVYDVKRRTTLLQRTPAWCDLQQVLEIYKKCIATTLSTNTLHEVDHYYPLLGNTVCGLHVPENLCIIPASQNRSKNNKHPDEFYKLETTNKLN